MMGEALARGLSVFASDIAVFREVGGEFVSYFDPLDPASIAQRLRRFLSTGDTGSRQPVSAFRWIGWEDSARQVLTELSQMNQSLPSVHRANPG